MLLPGLAVICAYLLDRSHSLRFLTGPLNKQTQHKSSVGSKLLKLESPERSLHCWGGGGFYAVIAGQGREFKVNAREVGVGKADARLKKRRETKAGNSCVSLLCIGLLNAIHPNSVRRNPKGCG